VVARLRIPWGIVDSFCLPGKAGTDVVYGQAILDSPPGHRSNTPLFGATRNGETRCGYAVKKPALQAIRTGRLRKYLQEPARPPWMDGGSAENAGAVFGERATCWYQHLNMAR
jgi:hypothetical protein